MRKVMIVCTGNTCRSPMAQGILKKILNEEYQSDLEIISAGISTIDGLKVSREALQVAAENGIDISGHLARQINSELIKEADTILTMTEGQARYIKMEFPEQKKCVYTLGEYIGTDADIPDPFGGGLELYEHIYTVLYDMLRQAAQRLSREK